MKNLTLSLFDKIHLKEECIITQTWITDSNLHHFMKISLQGLQEESDMPGCKRNVAFLHRMRQSISL